MIKHNKLYSLGFWLVQFVAVALIAGCGGSTDGTSTNTNRTLATSQSKPATATPVNGNAKSAVGTAWVDVQVQGPSQFTKTNSFEVCWHAVYLGTGGSSNISYNTLERIGNGTVTVSPGGSNSAGGSCGGIGGATSYRFQDTNVPNGIYKYHIKACGGSGSGFACSEAYSPEFSVIEPNGPLTISPKLDQAFLYPNTYIDYTGGKETVISVSGVKYFTDITNDGSWIENASAVAAQGYFQNTSSDAATGRNHGPRGSFSKWLATQNARMSNPYPPTWTKVQYYNDKELGIGRGMYCASYAPRQAPTTHVACYVVNCGDATDLTNDSPRRSSDCAPDETRRNDNFISAFFVGGDFASDGAKPPKYWGFDKTDQQISDLTQNTRNLVQNFINANPTLPPPIALNPNAPGSPTVAHNLQMLGGLPGAAVAMEWDRNAAVNPVKFLVFDYKRDFATTNIQLDGVSSTDVPGNCTTCHGGSISKDSSGTISVSGAHLLPFDAENMFGNNTAQKTASADAIKSLNNIVRITEDPYGSIVWAINSYLANPTSPDIPSAWKAAYNDGNGHTVAAADVTSVFNSIVRPNCSSCHLAKGGSFVQDPSSFFTEKVAGRVCGPDHTMPKAQVAEDNFYKNDGARRLMRKIFVTNLNIACLL